MTTKQLTHIIKISAITLGVISLFAIPAKSFAAGFWVEGREAYFTANKATEFALKGGYNAQNGLGIMVTNAYNTGKNLDQLVHSWNEIEGWYPLFAVTPQFTISPGLIVTSTKDGSGNSAYIDFNYKFTSNFNVTTRYRYNRQNYGSKDLDNKRDNNDTHEFAMYWNLRLNEEFSYVFEPHYYKRVNDFNSINGKKHNWQIHNKLTYRYNENWHPYIEAGWMDRFKSYNKEQVRFRIGVRYNFTE